MGRKSDNERGAGAQLRGVYRGLQEDKCEVRYITYYRPVNNYFPFLSCLFWLSFPDGVRFFESRTADRDPHGKLCAKYIKKALQERLKTQKYKLRKRLTC